MAGQTDFSLYVNHILAKMTVGIISERISFYVRICNYDRTKKIRYD